MFQHNAWDNVEWGEDQEREAQEAVDKQAVKRVEAEKVEDYEENASEYWDKFYENHQNRFFKERNWLFTEFPDLAPNYKGALRVYNDDTENTENCDNKAEACEDTVFNQSEVDSLRESETYFGEQSNLRLLEIGCGTGSTVFPILEMNTRPDLMIYCCDLSQTAVREAFKK